MGSELTTGTSVRIKDRLLFPRFYPRQVLKPSLRRAEPILVSWGQLIALTRSADPQNDVGEIADQTRVRPLVIGADGESTIFDDEQLVPAIVLGSGPCAG